MNYTDNQKKKVLISLKKGDSVADVSRKYNIPASTVRGWRRKKIVLSEKSPAPGPRPEGENMPGEGYSVSFIQAARAEMERGVSAGALSSAWNIGRGTLRRWKNLSEEDVLAKDPVFGMESMLAMIPPPFDAEAKEPTYEHKPGIGFVPKNDNDEQEAEDFSEEDVVPRKPLRPRFSPPADLVTENRALRELVIDLMLKVHKLGGSVR